MSEGLAPVALDIARVRLLYRIPPASAGGRMLELSSNGESLFGEQGWPGEVASVRISRDSRLSASPFPERYFDFAVMHRSLDRLLMTTQPTQREAVVHKLLTDVARLLKDGGVVAGCVENRHWLGRTRHLIRRAPYFSVMDCSKALSNAGFKDIRLFSVLPGLDSPTRLLSIEGRWSRTGSLRQVEALRPMVRPASYLLWRILAELGISQYLGAATFFWGSKAC